MHRVFVLFVLGVLTVSVCSCGSGGGGAAGGGGSSTAGSTEAFLNPQLPKVP